MGLLCTAGMLNGIFGEGETRHIAHWQSIKIVDRTEEEEDGSTVIREKERFSNELTLVFVSGEIATLKQASRPWSVPASPSHITPHARRNQGAYGEECP